jgi:hypothetical protein
MRALTGGRTITTGLVTAGLITGVALLGWALFGPMKVSVMSISEAVPGYWERLQKPLIKMEQKAPLVAIVSIIHTELYRKHYLPTVTDSGLDRLARITLHESLSDDK